MILQHSQVKTLIQGSSCPLLQTPRPSLRPADPQSMIHQ